MVILNNWSVRDIHLVNEWLLYWLNARKQYAIQTEEILQANHDRQQQ